MSKLSLYYEAQPFHVTQGWGVLDPKTYGPFGFTRHNGIDIEHGYNSRIRAPFPYQIYRTLWQPEGGGLVLSIVSLEKYDGPDGKPANVILDYLHLSKYIKTQGQGDTGDLLCIAGNTGAASTGPHTHIQPRWVRMVKGHWKDIEKNDANNSFNPMSFYNGLYAVDYKKPTEPVLTPLDPVKESLETVQALVGGIQKVPEKDRGPLYELYTAVLNALSKLLTKG